MSDRLQYERKPWVQYDPELAKVITPNAAAFFHQLVFWSDKGKRDDDWFYKSAEDIFNEIGLTPRMQDFAREKLVSRGYIDARKMMANGSQTWHYLILIKELVKEVSLHSTNVKLVEHDRREYPRATNETLLPTNVTLVHNSRNVTSITEDNHKITTEEYPLTPLEPKKTVNEVVDLINQLFGRQFRATKGLADKYKTRRVTYGHDEILEAVRKADADKFYHGDNDRRWCLSPEYVLRSDEVIDKLLNLTGEVGHSQVVYDRAVDGHVFKTKEDLRDSLTKNQYKYTYEADGTPKIVPAS